VCLQQEIQCVCALLWASLDLYPSIHLFIDHLEEGIATGSRDGRVTSDVEEAKRQGRSEEGRIVDYSQREGRVDRVGTVVLLQGRRGGKGRGGESCDLTPPKMVLSLCTWPVIKQHPAEVTQGTLHRGEREVEAEAEGITGVFGAQENTSRDLKCHTATKNPY
jgi:hypothetical protein